MPLITMAHFRKSVAIVLIGLVVFWYLDTPLPDDMQEKWKVRIIDASMRTYGHLNWLLCTLGLMEPFSQLDRTLADIFVITMTTGRPWVQRTDPALKITDLHTEETGVHMRMYEPVTSLHQARRPVLFYMHGGGFSVLSTDSYDALTRRIARQSGVVVISINYRLSPQVPYPGPLNDCIEVIDYVTANSESLRIDTTRFAVGGDSAGGNLAASISLRLRDRIKLQLLLVPFLQLLTFNTTSVVQNKQYFSKTSNNVGQLVFATNYIGCCREYIADIINSNHTSTALKKSKYAEYVYQERWMDKRHIWGDLHTQDLSQRKDFGREDITREFIEKITDPYLSPLMADDALLRGLPRAYVMTAGYDLIRDDGVMYAQRLKFNGVPVQHVNHRTSFHTALTFVEGPFQLGIGRTTVQDITYYLQMNV